MQVSQLCVVAPRCDPRDGEAYKVACRGQVLDGMRVVDDLAEALADTAGWCVCVCGGVYVGMGM